MHLLRQLCCVCGLHRIPGLNDKGEGGEVIRARTDKSEEVGQVPLGMRSITHVPPPSVDIGASLSLLASALSSEGGGDRVAISAATEKIAQLKLVGRFWYNSAGTEPADTDSIRTASSWAKFGHQVIFTNVAADMWPQLEFPHTFVDYDRPAFLEQLDIAPQLLKDLWQHKVPSVFADMLCIDWDFQLVNASRLPDGVLVATEFVKTTGAFAPALSRLVKPGVRCHLGMSRYPLGSPTAAAIVEQICANLPSLDGIVKTNNSGGKWMSNTYIAQKVNVDAGTVFAEPIIVNPVPFWNVNLATGELFGTLLPTLEQMTSGTATFSRWSGFNNFEKTRELLLEHLCPDAAACENIRRSYEQNRKDTPTLDMCSAPSGASCERSLATARCTCCQ